MKFKVGAKINTMVDKFKDSMGYDPTVLCLGYHKFDELKTECMFYHSRPQSEFKFSEFYGMEIVTVKNNNDFIGVC